MARLGGNLPLENPPRPRRRAGMPHIDRTTVVSPGLIERGHVIELPERPRYSEFPMGATVKVEMFPGDPAMVAWDFQRHPRAEPRRKGMISGLRIRGQVPQTVSDFRRAQLAGIDQVPPGTLDIFEGIA